VISLSRVKDVISGHDGLPRFPAPPDLSGKNRPDRAMRITELLADKYLRVLTAYDYNPEIAGHNPDTAMNMVVSTREVVATDENVVRLRFESTDGSPIPPWHPGSHLDFHLPSGLRRQY